MQEIDLNLSTANERSKTLIKAASDTVKMFVATLTNATSDEVDNIRICTYEAIANSFTYAYPGEVGCVRVHCHVDRYANVVVQVTDYGKGFSEDLWQTACGTGFTAMQSLSKKCDVWSTPGDRTIVRLHFKISEGIKIDSRSK
jgi:anti-sigma regulatory factor (Ser/Thr protein kinase)